MSHTFRYVIAPIALWVAIVVAIAGVATIVHVSQFADDCTNQGGNYSLDGAEAHCRF